MAIASETYPPAPHATAVRTALAAHGGSSTPPSLMWVNGERIELPPTIYQALVQVVDAMAEGKAVTVTPADEQLTTQEAADLLYVSRPTVVRLIESGQLPAERIGNRRRVLRSDVLALRVRRREAQLQALAATTTDIADEQYLD